MSPDTLTPEKSAPVVDDRPTYSTDLYDLDSDWSEEQTDYAHEIKELALAHQVTSAVERAYRRTDLFDKRRALMADWATFCMGASP